MKKDHEPYHFEAALSRLEAIVGEMEKGTLTLEDALIRFEEGIRLTRECQKALDTAERRVQVLLEESGEIHTSPFTPEQ